MSDEKPKTVAFTMNMPTNREAAKRPYCKKHSRAMLDIGGEKRCPECQKEASKP